MIAINAQIDWTLTHMSPNTNVCNCGLFWASNLAFFCELKRINQNNPIYSLHLQHVTISISTTLLFNTAKLGLVPIYSRKKN